MMNRNTSITIRPLRLYEAPKIKLSSEHTFDREEYTDEKLAFVNKVIQLSERT